MSAQLRSYSETAEEQRERRLQRRRERETELARRAAETAEQRKERLARRRVRDRARQAAQTQQEQLATETEEQREARLPQSNINQQERLATETEEQREARLQQLRTNRLATETAVQREARPRAKREQPFKQRSVQLKMKTFHEYFTLVSSPRCSTCSEGFPGIQLCPSTTECMRCYRDKHTPKLYSSANSMNPGPLPPQLQGLTQVEEMLISAVLPIVSLYKLPHGVTVQATTWTVAMSSTCHKMHVTSFADSLPRLPSVLDVIIVRKEGATNISFINYLLFIA